MKHFLFFMFIVSQLVAQQSRYICSKKLVAKQKLLAAKKIEYSLLPAPTATSVLPAFSPSLEIICLGEPVTFTNTSIDALTYTWDFGDGNNSSLDNPTHTYTTTGQYIITLTAINGTVQGTAAGAITVNNFPNADFTIQQLNNCDGSTQFNCVGSFTNNSWNFSDGTTINDTCNMTKTFSKATTYTVTHIVNPNNYCSSTITKDFAVTNYNEDLGEIPNVITPNFDGKNDFVDFSKYVKCGDFEFQIFDRWGLEIISSLKTNQGIWDGRTLAGQEVTNGTYFYTIKTANKSYKGTINVFR